MAKITKRSGGTIKKNKEVKKRKQIWREGEEEKQKFGKLFWIWSAKAKEIRDPNVKKKKKPVIVNNKDNAKSDSHLKY